MWCLDRRCVTYEQTFYFQTKNDKTVDSQSPDQEMNRLPSKIRNRSVDEYTTTLIPLLCYRDPKLKKKKKKEKEVSTRNQLHTPNDIVYDITFNKWQKLKIQAQSRSRQTMEHIVQTYKTYVTSGYDVIIRGTA